MDMRGGIRFLGGALHVCERFAPSKVGNPRLYPGHDVSVCIQRRRRGRGTVCISSHQEKSNIEVAKMITKRIVHAEDWKDIRKSLIQFESDVNVRHLTTAMYFLTKKNVCMCLYVVVVVFLRLIL